MTKISYSGYRFPPVIIQQAVWLYARFTLSFRDVEDLLAERGIMVSYETVRRWVKYFGRRTRISRPDEGSARRFLSFHAATYNTFNVQRHLISAKTHRAFRASAIRTSREVAAAA